MKLTSYIRSSMLVCFLPEKYCLRAETPTSGVVCPVVALLILFILSVERLQRIGPYLELCLFLLIQCF